VTRPGLLLLVCGGVVVCGEVVELVHVTSLMPTAALSKPPPPSPRRAPPLGLGERGITADIPVEPRYPGG